MSLMWMILLDRKQQILIDTLAEHEQPEIAVLFFQKDAKKAEGSYVTATGNLKKIDRYERVIVFVNGKQIPFDDVFNITSVIFKDL